MTCKEKTKMKVFLLKLKAADSMNYRDMQTTVISLIEAVNAA